MQLQQPNQSLRINKADTSKNVHINYKYVFNPHKILGHYKAPVGTGKVQVTVLAEQDKQYAYRVTKASLTCHEAWMYYTSCYQKYVGYALVQMFLPKHTLDKLGQNALRAFTSKCL